MSNNDTTDNNDDTMVKVTVDAEACIGAGQCEMHDPAVFTIDDDDVIAKVIEPGLLPLERAQDAVDRCPAAAISIVED